MTTQLEGKCRVVEQNGKSLPIGWKVVRLGEVAEINPRRPPGLDRADSQPTTFVPMSAVNEQHGVIASPETKPFAEVKKGYTYFAEGDVLFAKITPCMQNGKHAIARELIDGIGFGTTEFHVIRPGTNLIAEWGHFYIRRPRILRDAMAHFTGAVGQQRVPKDFLTDLEIPLPPLAEQKRIAGILKEKLAAVQRARAATAAQLEAAKALSAAFLRDVFEGHEASSWPRQRIGEYAKVQSGYAFKSDWFVDDGIRLLRNANVFQNRIEWDDVVCLPESRRSEFVEFELAVGDIVLTLDRPVVNNGLKVARLSPQDVPALLLQRVGRFRLRSNIDSSFLFAFLNSPRFIDQITGHDQSLGVPHVSPKQVEAVEFPVPDATTQRKVAGQIERQWKIIRGLRESTLEQLEAINAMPAALLRAAFQGQL